MLAICFMCHQSASLSCSNTTDKKYEIIIQTQNLLFKTDKLNNFHGCFECNGASVTLPISESGNSRQSSDDHVITMSEDEVRRELKTVRVRKAAGPDGITGRILRSCTDQLAGLFTSIFNESLATSVVPTSFKKCHPCA